MARYRKVSIRMWGDAKVRLLSTPPPNGRDCWWYLMTAKESTNIPGLVQAAGKPRCSLCLVPLQPTEPELCATCAEDRERRLETERLARVIRIDAKERLR